MKILNRNHIDLINYQEFLIEKRLTNKMLEGADKKREIWISGQNL